MTPPDPRMLGCLVEANGREDEKVKFFDAKQIIRESFSHLRLLLYQYYFFLPTEPGRPTTCSRTGSNPFALLLFFTIQQIPSNTCAVLYRNGISFFIVYVPPTLCSVHIIPVVKVSHVGGINESDCHIYDRILFVEHTCPKMCHTIDGINESQRDIPHPTFILGKVILFSELILLTEGVPQQRVPLNINDPSCEKNEIPIGTQTIYEEQ